ncbi:MAG: methylated-DNA--[protein]-cysteine S-methyltransferase [Desulfobacterales bacterium]|nr:methylated-DNA--[protein]-cysteine S-methyltransferase [Desulfobacterales bacterium]
MHRYNRFTTSLCDIIVAGDERGITHLHLCTQEGKREFTISPHWQLDPNFFKETTDQILAFVDGKRHHFDLPIAPCGTDFQKKVWRALTQIPYGELRTYKEIAQIIGHPKAFRAVGMANGKNPIPLLIPCHRVVGADGKLTGFAHGLAIKKRLIQLEASCALRSKPCTTLRDHVDGPKKNPSVP